MNELTFCAKCGHETLNWDGEKKWSCSKCDYVLFHNVAAAVAVLITYKGEILFTRRNQEPKKGKLDLPGGFVDPLESAEETCVRELFEELKIQLEQPKLKHLTSLPNTYLYKNILYNTLDLFYAYEVEEKFDVILELSEISDIIWLKKENLHLEDIAFDSQRLFLEQYIISN